MKENSISRLPMVQQFKLIEYVREHYISVDLVDEAFAAKASEDLGFPVTKGNVVGVRKSFGIEGTADKRVRLAREAAVVGNQEGLQAQVYQLYCKIVVLENKLSDLTTKLGGL